MTSPIPIIEINNLTYSYGDQNAIQDVTLTVYSNDFLAVIGPNGGGKSTLVKLIVGQLSPLSGSIKVFGVSPEQARSQIGYLPQYIIFDRSYPIEVIDVVRMSRLSKGVFHIFSDSDTHLALEKLRQFGVEKLANRPFSQLSGGEKQRVLLARAIMNSPKLLILDEPTTGVDSKTQSEFYKLLHQLNNEMAIVMISHDLSAVSQHVKSIACMNQVCVYHGTKELSPSDLEHIYGCDIELIAHGTPHRVIHRHD